jgi:hypothetical protein
MNLPPTSTYKATATENASEQRTGRVLGNGVAGQIVGDGIGRLGLGAFLLLPLVLLSVALCFDNDEVVTSGPGHTPLEVVVENGSRCPSSSCL